MRFTLYRGLRVTRWRATVALRSLISLYEGWRWLGKPSSPLDTGTHWAFIRLDGVGDFWLWLPFIASLRKAHPELPFVLVANPLWEELAQLTGLFQVTFSVDPVRFRRETAYRKAVLLRLRSELPPIAELWQTTYSRRIRVEDLLAWATSASKRSAWQRDPNATELSLVGRWVDKRLYSRIYPSSLPPLLHEWLRYEYWLRMLGLPGLDFTIYPRLRQKLFVSNGGPYIVVVGGAGAAYRMPPMELQSYLLQRLYHRLRLPLYFLGAASDAPWVERLMAHLPQIPRESFCGKLSLVEAARKVANAFLVVTPETGLGHIAATLGVPTLMWVGGGHWGRFAPYPVEAPFALKVLAQEMPCFGCGWHCGYQLADTHPPPCLQKFSPEAVTEKALLWLDALLGLPTLRA